MAPLATDPTGASTSDTASTTTLPTGGKLLLWPMQGSRDPSGRVWEDPPTGPNTRGLAMSFILDFVNGTNRYTNVTFVISAVDFGDATRERGIYMFGGPTGGDVIRREEDEEGVSLRWELSPLATTDRTLEPGQSVKFAFNNWTPVRSGTARITLSVLSDDREVMQFLVADVVISD